MRRHQSAFQSDIVCGQSISSVEDRAPIDWQVFDDFVLRGKEDYDEGRFSAAMFKGVAWHKAFAIAVQAWEFVWAQAMFVANESFSGVSAVHGDQGVQSWLCTV